MFPGIKIRGRLTKNNDFFRISCHLLPANKLFQKVVYTFSHCSAAAKIIKKHKISTFLIFLKFFEYFERNQDARSVFNFVIFEEFGSLIMEICGILPKSVVRSRPLDQPFPGVVAFYLPYRCRI